MANYRYKALAQSGAIDTGVLEAKDVATAQRQLRSQRLTPLSVTLASQAGESRTARRNERNALPDPDSARALLDRVSSENRAKKAKKRFDQSDVLRFTAEMSVLLKAGLPLDRALKVQVDSSPEGQQKILLEDLIESL